MKPPGLCEDPPDEAGGVGLEPVHAAWKVGSKAIECAPIEAHEPGGASLDTNVDHATTKGTASVKLIGMAEKAAAAEPEALEPRAESMAWCGLEMTQPPPP